MKTIGLIGGMSWESTTEYYTAINQEVKSKLGGFNSAKIILNSINFAEIEVLQRADNWPEMTSMLTEAAKSLEAAGAECLLICTNTMHKVAPEVEASINIPLIHIADTTASELINDQVSCVGLLGTQFTMQQAFYKQRFIEKFGIDVIVPNLNDQKVIHQVIYEELCLGKVIDSSKFKYLEIIEKLANSGAQAVILGCTEIAMLVGQTDTQIPLYNTTDIHAKAAVAFALGAD